MCFSELIAEKNLMGEEDSVDADNKKTGWPGGNSLLA